MFQVFIDEEEVWRHRVKPGKSFVTLTGHFIKNKEDKRWRSFSLSKNENEHQDDIEQIVNAVSQTTIIGNLGNDVMK